jgi:aminobenzoyl-glutamate transport protein
MQKVQSSKGSFNRFLNLVESAGNKLPQPVSLFAILILIVLLVSWLAAVLGLSAVHPGTGEKINAVNLLSADGIQRMFTDMVKVFAAFPPLGLVLVVMLGIGVAESSGLISAALKAFISSVPTRLVTFSVVVAGMLSSLAADAGYVVLIPLGAVIFNSMGRHPIAGLAAAFAGVSGGFSANLLLTSLDPLLAGFTGPAAQLIDPAYVVDPTANWYLMAALVPILGVTGTFVTERIIEPRLGLFSSEVSMDEVDQNLKPEERRGLWASLLVIVVLLGLVAWMVIPADGILRDAEGGLKPFFESIVVLMFFLFLFPGIVYGKVAGTIKGEKDVSDMMTAAMASMGAYIVLAFVAAQFVAYFNWSNIGVIFAISGASGLQTIGFTGIPLIVSFILLSSVINLFIGSASAKWAIMAPIFVPMLMLLGYSPELTQAAYRIGDSYTNILTPLLPYFPLIIIYAQKYDKKVGIGTLISVMLPFSIAFAIVSILMIVAWMVFGWPVGPDAPMLYQVK